jgi:hypothetical protein
MSTLLSRASGCRVRLRKERAGKVKQDTRGPGGPKQQSYFTSVIHHELHKSIPTEVNDLDHLHPHLTGTVNHDGFN